MQSLSKSFSISSNLLFHIPNLLFYLVFEIEKIFKLQAYSSLTFKSSNVVSWKVLDVLKFFCHKCLKNFLTSFPFPQERMTNFKRFKFHLRLKKSRFRSSSFLSGINKCLNIHLSQWTGHLLYGPERWSVISWRSSDWVPLLCSGGPWFCPLCP